MDKATIVSYPDEFSKEEIVGLARAAGYSVEAVVTQKQIIKSEFGVGVGKAESLREIVEVNGSNTLIVDERLTSSQSNNLSKVTKVEVVDRERLILNIFARRALTAEAKLQVQLAELRYELPRARDAVRYSVRGERAGFSGMGETAVDVKFRALKQRMSAIKEKLVRAQSHRVLQRRERKKLDIPFVSLAGYTSSGKTTIFNKMTSESRDESPNLFTTLTTTTRAISLADHRKRVLLSDTVGFISRLPTYMVESFKSTLEELTYADLILLVLDVSEDKETVHVKLESCRDILNQLDVNPEKILLVLNKIDLLVGRPSDAPSADSAFGGFATVKISAARGDGMHLLRNRILERAYPNQAIRTGTRSI